MWICLQCRRSRFVSWVRKICWRRDRLPTPVFLGFPCGSAGKESACNVGDVGLIPGLGRFPGEGKGYSLQYSGLKNSKGLSLWASLIAQLVKNAPAMWETWVRSLASITSHIHSWVLFLLWLHLFIISGVISPLISSSILGTC